MSSQPDVSEKSATVNATHSLNVSMVKTPPIMPMSMPNSSAPLQA